jgi:hypothetical protein
VARGAGCAQEIAEPNRVSRERVTRVRRVRARVQPRLPQREVLVALRVVVGAAQEPGLRRIRDPRAADPAEEAVQPVKLVALVIVLRDLRTQRLARHLVERPGDTQAGHENQELEEQRGLRGPEARRQQPVIEGCTRDQARIDVRLASSVTRPRVVRDVTEEGVGDRVHDERDREREAGQARREPEHLVVVVEEETVRRRDERRSPAWGSTRSEATSSGSGPLGSRFGGSGCALLRGGETYRPPASLPWNRALTSESSL